VIRKYPFSLLIAALAASILITGCKQLQAGYYLTPENYPTAPGVLTSTPESAKATSTPVSTINSVFDVTAIPTPIPTLTASPTTVTFICHEMQGSVTEYSFLSQTTKKQLKYRIYLPPCYSQTQKRYPYVIMMHGLVPGSTVMNDDQWVRLGLTDAEDQGYLDGSLPPMIIVMPDGNNALHGNDDSQFGAIIVSELIPQVEAGFCVWAAPEGRAIGGLSRGGFWAFSIAFLHPELFNRVGGHSPFLYDGDYKVYNPYNLADTVKDIDKLSYYIDYGAQDYVADGVQDFTGKLHDRGITIKPIVNSTGAHTEDYWASHVSEYLAFYGETWPKDALQLPDCDGILPAATPEG
jgi:enterochelin esterase-like enzyme